MPRSRTRLTPLAFAILLTVPRVVLATDMSAYWPNDDGRSWSYNQHFEEMDDVHQVIDNQVRVFFDGTTVAPNAITAQYLREVLVSGTALASATRADATFGDPLLAHVWAARPDLHGRILQALADSPCPDVHPAGGYAVLLGGEFAYVKTASEIAAWRCNLADTRSWLFLVSDLTIGNTFTLQLIPDLASDVFLHGRIAAIEDATVPAGTFANCLRVEYTVDYGLSACTDANGNVIGTSRAETVGFIHFAPGQGPVESYEQCIPYAEETGSCGGTVGAAAAVVTLQLNSAVVPAKATSWGRLKMAYR